MRSVRETILITGATGGIGSAIAKTLDEAGYTLLLTGRNATRLEHIKQSLVHGPHQAIALDLTQDGDLRALTAAAQESDINGVINCLGVNCLAEIDQMSPRETRDMVTINLLTPMHICRLITPMLKTKNSSFMINVGSILGSIGSAGSAVYCASKFGLRGFTESLRRELADSDVAVIYIAPRATSTALNSPAMEALNRKLGNAVDPPERVAKKVRKAIEKRQSKSYYLGFPEAFFVKLNSVFPSLVDKALFKQLPTIKHFCRHNQKQQKEG